MEDKAYIVANKQQELDVLKKLEKDGFNWPSGLNPTNFFPSNSHPFPIVLFERDWITWDFLDSIKNEEIVFDGRKEEKMYKVTQEFMNELINWRDEQDINAETRDLYAFVCGNNISKLPDVIENWWVDLDDPIDNNNRLIAIIQWLNGEDVFEVEEPRKFVVRSDKTGVEGNYTYVMINQDITTTLMNDTSLFGETNHDMESNANLREAVEIAESIISDVIWIYQQNKDCNEASMKEASDIAKYSLLSIKEALEDLSEEY